MAKQSPTGSSKKRSKRHATKVNYREGDLFAVPLKPSGYATGLIARTSKKGVLFGYFFGPRHAKPPLLVEVQHLLPKQAVLLRRFGDLGLLQGDWPILGAMSEFTRAAWPMPLFVRYSHLSGKPWFLVEYSEDDLLTPISETRVVAAVPSLPEDVVSGFAAVEVRLAQLL
jgi:hypothetical protein